MKDTQDKVNMLMEMSSDIQDRFVKIAENNSMLEHTEEGIQVVIDIASQIENKLSFIKDNKNLYIAYFTNGQILSSDKSLDEIFKYIIMPISKKRGAKDQRKVLYCALFYIGGITNIIKHWLDNGFKESVEYIASIIVDLRNSNKDI